MLKDAFGISDVNELPISFNIAWYEQKAVLVLLALLSLGFKNIRVGPTLPAFLPPGVAKALADSFGLVAISGVEEDLKQLVG
jgi:hydroxylamine reductase